MSTTSTTNLGLVKPTPGTGEYADVSVINSNMDTIDAAVGDVDVTTDGSLQEQVTALGESVTPTAFTVQTSLSGTFRAMKFGGYFIVSGAAQFAAGTENTLCTLPFQASYRFGVASRGSGAGVYISSISQNDKITYDCGTAGWMSFVVFGMVAQ